MKVLEACNDPSPAVTAVKYRDQPSVSSSSTVLQKLSVYFFIYLTRWKMFHTKTVNLQDVFMSFHGPRLAEKSQI